MGMEYEMSRPLQETVPGSGAVRQRWSLALRSDAEGRQAADGRDERRTTIWKSRGHLRHSIERRRFREGRKSTYEDMRMVCRQST